ncbi:MAG: DUF7793 family protein [Bacteroidia bacterium]
MAVINKQIRLKKSIHEVIHQNPLIIRIESSGGEFVELEDAEGMRDANVELSDGNPYFVLLDTSKGYASATPEANKIFAEKKYSENRKAIAIIAKSLASKIVSNFFIRFNQPQVPTRVFMNEQEAMDWLLNLPK